jgi:hypothetical protein
MNKKSLAREIVKIAKILVAHDDWRKKIIGRDFRLRYNDQGTSSILMEELPEKGKRTLRVFAANVWMGGHFSIINDSNIVSKVTPSMGFDQAKKAMLAEIEELKAIEVKDYHGDPEHMKFAVQTNEYSVNVMKVAPEGMDKIIVEGKDFKVTADWNSFSAYDPGSDFQSMDPSYTKYNSSSPMAARKFYKMARANPDLLKNISWGAFSTWLNHNGIKYKTHFSQWR